MCHSTIIIGFFFALMFLLYLFLLGSPSVGANSTGLKMNYYILKALPVYAMVYASLSYYVPAHVVTVCLFAEAVVVSCAPS